MMNSYRETREGLGLSQTAFAAMVGTTYQSIQRWERGAIEPSAAARSLYRLLAWAVETDQAQGVIESLKKD